MFDFFRKKKKENNKKDEYVEDTYGDSDSDYEDDITYENSYSDESDYDSLEEGQTITFESSSDSLNQEVYNDENTKVSEDEFISNDSYDQGAYNNSLNQEDSNEKSTGFFGRIRDGLLKTRNQFSSQIKSLFTANVKIDDDMYEELEDILISADIGMDTTLAIVDSLKYEIKERSIKDSNEIYPLLEEIMVRHLDRDNLDNDLNIKDNELAIILVIGVNGVGKTTTIGKLAYNLQKEGKSVMLAAADTFRAAAIEQLGEWADKSNVEMVAHSEGADPSAVIFDAIKSAKNKNIDALICDTAGRLHNKKNLMKELEKINKTIDSHAGAASRENLLVLDATTGQNAVSQLREFKNVTDITGLILTKLDGTAKGGIIFPLQYELNVPVKYIGLGEGIDNLEKFDSKTFVDAMF